jgi:hypothetical protein
VAAARAGALILIWRGSLIVIWLRPALCCAFGLALRAASGWLFAVIFSLSLPLDALFASFTCQPFKHKGQAGSEKQVQTCVKQAGKQQPKNPN